MNTATSATPPPSPTPPWSTTSSAIARTARRTRKAATRLGCHHPRKRVIQYPRDQGGSSVRGSPDRGLLDAPLARAMTTQFVGADRVRGTAVDPSGATRRFRSPLLRAQHSRRQNLHAPMPAHGFG